METVERLAIIADVTALIHTYARLNDAGDFAAVAALYTPDGRLARPVAPDAVVSGQDAILASFTARPPRRTRHLVSNVEVMPDAADAARATSVIALHIGNETGGLASVVIGGFRDRVVRTPHGWRFAERLGWLDFRQDF